MRPTDTLVRLGVTDAATAAIVFVAAGVSLFAGFAAVEIGSHPEWGVIGTLAACALVAERQETVLSSRLAVSAAGPIGVLAAVVLGPLGGWIVGFCAMLTTARAPLAKWFAQSNLFAAACALGGFAAEAIGPLEAQGSVRVLCLQALAAAACILGANLLSIAFISVLRRIHPLAATLRVATATLGSGYVFAIPLVASLAYGYHLAGLPALSLTLLPLLGTRAVLGLYKENAELITRQSEGDIAFALGLIRALDERDSYTAGHSAAVAVYAHDIARAAGYGREETSAVQLAALLHDIGKIGVSAGLLTKATPLSPDEWAEIRRHPEIGERIAGEAATHLDIRGTIRHHHERPDGSGYPDGLAGEDLPESAAIVGLADAYNAMTSPRAYRPAMRPCDAMAELERGRGTQFLPALVDVFLVLLRLADEDYRSGTGPRFSLAGQRDAILGALAARRQLEATAA
jgi:putative nucleotidyltransferase with HDIG domain